MPRLHGYRERLDMDLWDSFTPKNLLNEDDRGPWDPGSHRIQLFGNENIGQYTRTNMQVAGLLACDLTTFIHSWYARTNLIEVYEQAKTSEFTRAWSAWANVTIATIYVGQKPMLSAPLHTLLGPRTFGGLCGVRERGDEDDIRKIAEDSFLRVNGPCKETLADLPLAEQQIWLQVARACPLYRPIVVPCRQTLHVAIDSDLRATEALIKVMPENVAPMPLVWVHIAGIVSRDIG